MTLNELTNLANRITYKGKSCMAIKWHDWRNNHNPVPEGYVFISVWIHAICVIDGSNTQIEVGNLHAIADIESTSEWSHINWLKNEIVGLETHEVEESFSVDGERVFDPHKDRELTKVNLQVA